ncbi:MAG TPA: hypothetical protein VJN69_08710 [Candidatus Acidoferrales bacterium]|nr:hypothetical protein [Candidatus Acidoferrales bacterium]
MSSKRILAVPMAALAALIIFSGCSFSPTNASVESAAPPPLQFVGEWGSKGNGPGQLDQPASIATDMRSNVYIADAGSGFIEKFQPGGTPLLAFQDPALKHPQEIAIDRGGAIYVSDPVRQSVFVFLPEGPRYRVLRMAGRGNAENTLDVAVDDAGSVSVLDVNAAKLYDFNSRFRLAHVWKPGMDIAAGPGRPTSVTSGPLNAIFVGGLGANSLLRFVNGSFTSQVTLAAERQPDAHASGSSDPRSAAPDATPHPPIDALSNRIGSQFAISSNYIFLVDPDGKTLHVWTIDGKPKGDFDLSGQLGEDRRAAPPIAVTPANDLLVLDAQKARVYRYRINF